MAPAPRGNPKIVITTPKTMSLTDQMITFSAADFNLSWLEFFKKYEPLKPLYEQLHENAAEYILQDNRRPMDKKMWTLTSSVKVYINSFQKTMQHYQATVTRRIPSMKNVQEMPPESSPRRAAASASKTRAGQAPPKAERSSNATGVPPKKRHAPDNGRAASTAPAKKGRAEEVNMRVGGRNFAQLAPRAPIYLNIDIDETASMANSIDSQDSMDDLHAQNVHIKDIKRDVVQNILKHIDNAMMLRIRQELKSVEDNGKWLRIARHLPITANALQLVFKKL